jgi:hypothetical protein
MNFSTKQRIIRIGKKLFKIFYKLGMTTAAVTAATNPISAAIAGIGLAASALSSSVKDRNLGKLAPLINALAINIDKAENSDRKNF